GLSGPAVRLGAVAGHHAADDDGAVVRNIVRRDDVAGDGVGDAAGPAGLVPADDSAAVAGDAGPVEGAGGRGGVAGLGGVAEELLRVVEALEAADGGPIGRNAGGDAGPEVEQTGGRGP